MVTEGARHGHIGKRSRGRIAICLAVALLGAGCSSTDTVQRPIARPDVVCRPAGTADPLAVGLATLCEVYRGGRLDTPSYREALAEYPVLIVGVEALAGLDPSADAALPARSAIEVALRRNAALRAVCSAPVPPAGELGAVCRLLTTGSGPA